MTNMLNSSQQVPGYVVVKVEQTRPQTITFLNLEYESLNPTTYCDKSIVFFKNSQCLFEI